MTSGAVCPSSNDLAIMLLSICEWCTKEASTTKFLAAAPPAL
eukprot:CAMPEP_0170472140 /NCGR_PEP_ID=MMETSP0123-20130129/14229_1 /TAXON_ID=182087 /ORGANISM="Favella ehrenbergii, Strain Fehren 1" /LENGTH=41 /DNA_ID= /DNA_START= /DNA_END= /DNA_ORIENTATION=